MDFTLVYKVCAAYSSVTRKRAAAAMTDVLEEPSTDKPHAHGLVVVVALVVLVLSGIEAVLSAMFF